MYTPQAVMRQKNSWPRAFLLFMRSSESGPLRKRLAVLLAAYLPVNIVNDVVPLLGQLDDVALPLNAASLIYLVWKVRKYR